MLGVAKKRFKAAIINTFSDMKENMFNSKEKIGKPNKENRSH